MASPEQGLFSVSAPARPLTRAVPWVVLAVIVGLIAYDLADNPRLGWAQVGTYFFNSQILKGLLGTIELTVLGGVIALILGVIIVGVGRLGSVGAAISAAYIWFFRAVPLMVQLVLWFNAALIVPRIANVSTNTLISAFAAAVIGLSLHESAYVAEIIRGGLLSVPPGQYRASAALGMTAPQAYRHVIGPQVVRVVIPALTNQMIGLLKATATVAFIGGSDLLTNATQIYQQNFETIPLLIVVTIWYLILVGLSTIGQHFIERRYNTEIGKRKPATASAAQTAEPVAALDRQEA